jgi:hypothetical protein
MARIAVTGTAGTVAIEHDDPFVPATAGIPAAARILADAAERAAP